MKLMEIDDKYIIDKFWPNNMNMYLRRNKYNKVAKEEKEYLINRFSDSNSIDETLYRIKYHVYVVPVCPTCGKKLTYSKLGRSYGKYCNKSCASKDPRTINARKKGIYNKYGCYCTMQLKDTIEKSKKTWANKTKQEILAIKEKAKETSIQKYGIDNWCGQKKNSEHWRNKTREEIEEITNKKRKTCLKHYGVDNYTKTKEWRKHASEISPIIKEKSYVTMKKTHSYLGGTSKAEKKALEMLKQTYPDIIHQYRDNIKYPWNCDFYVPSKDLFIEYQGYYTHGKHPYNKDDEEDRKELERLKHKYGSDSQAVTIWSIKDVEKRETAKKNNLNYIEFFTLKEVEKYIENPIF